MNLYKKDYPRTYDFTTTILNEHYPHRQIEFVGARSTFLNELRQRLFWEIIEAVKNDQTQVSSACIYAPVTSDLIKRDIVNILASSAKKYDIPEKVLREVRIIISS